MPDSSDDDEGGKTRAKSRRELPAGAVATLKAWLLSPEHFTHPYPTPQDQVMLMQKTGIDKKQLKNWFTNARRRIWKPMLKKQLEQGKLTATAGGGVAVPGGVVQPMMVSQMQGRMGGQPDPMGYQQAPIQQHQEVSFKLLELWWGSIFCFFEYILIQIFSLCPGSCRSVWQSNLQSAANNASRSTATVL